MSNTVIEALEQEFESMKEDLKTLDDNYNRKIRLLDNKLDEQIKNECVAEAVGSYTLTDHIREHLRVLITLGYEIDHIVVTEKGERELQKEHEKRVREGYTLVFNADVKVNPSIPGPSWPHNLFKVVIK